MHSWQRGGDFYIYDDIDEDKADEGGWVDPSAEEKRGKEEEEEEGEEE